MVLPSEAAPATPAIASRNTRPARLPSSGSFHAGAPFPDLSPYDNSRRRSSLGVRRQSSHRYHTFPTPPPKSAGRKHGAGFSRGSASSSMSQGGDSSETDNGGGDEHGHRGPATPLPFRQLGLLALLSLAEQTALNSISPYLPNMVLSVNEISTDQVGLYVGLLASAFALAQLATNLLWGYLSDTVGRKPVMLAGTLLLAICFAFFGFCRTFWQVLVVHIAMGLLNGNAAVVPTVLGEVTDRSNQSSAFTWLPVMYSIGGITGPALGGLLVRGDDTAFPFVVPNIASAALLLVSVAVLGIWFEETLDDVDRKAARAGLGWLERLFDWGGSRESRKGRQGSWVSRWPRHGDHDDVNEDEEGAAGGDTGLGDEAALLEHDSGRQGYPAEANDGKLAAHKSAFRQLLNVRTILVLMTYLVFQLCNISFNSLYPIFASTPPPTGRGLGPGTIGVSLSLAGVATILFQIFVFQPLKTRLGNLGTYRTALLGLCISMVLMPWIGYRDGKPPFGWGSSQRWLYAELGVVLIIKNAAAVGGLSCVLLLITNSAPSHETLGTLNGIAQTLSAAGRSVGPFLSGGLFTLSTHIKPKGELLAWGIFGGVSLVGWVLTLAIRGNGLESADWVGDDDEDYERDDDQDRPEV